MSVAKEIVNPQESSPFSVTAIAGIAGACLLLVIAVTMALLVVLRTKRTVTGYSSKEFAGESTGSGGFGSLEDEFDTADDFMAAVTQENIFTFDFGEPNSE
jgi:hypothetical protein